jgi:uncharacterized protein YjdB
MKIKQTFLVLCMLCCFFQISNLQAQTLQVESMTVGGPYAGAIASPFSGVAFYGNGDKADGTITLPNATGIYDITITGASSGNNAQIDLYIGGSKVGVYSFNGTSISTDTKSISITSTGTNKSVQLLLSTDNGSNDTYVDKIAFTYTGAPLPPRTAPVLPTTASFDSGVYRNMFVESGKNATAVSTKLNDMWNQYFVNGDATSGKLLYNVGTDMAYILDTGNNDIRSEGMSYGMMIAVQLDKKTEFDKLWKFAKTYSQHPAGTDRAGLFSWQLNSSSFAKMDPNSAPDGEEYYVTALFFAHARWGSGTGINNYRAEADYILDSMLNKPAANSGSCPTDLVDLNQNQVVLGICGDSATYTDPSYHLASFYEIWARYAKNNNALWAAMANTSRTYLLPRAANSVTGLMPDYAEFNGAPKAVGTHARFEYDSWRNIMNMGFDQAWFKKNATDITPLINRQIDFFKDKTGYQALWDVAGTNPNGGHSPGLVACNAVGSLALADAKVWPFIDEFYDTPIPSGQYRYYDGLLYMMSYMHLSGNFKAYKLDGTANVLITGVTMSPTTVSVAVGATTTLSATVAPSNATNKNVSWSSSNISIATVNTSGVVSGVGAGTATITVTTQDGSKIATSAITVTAVNNNVLVTGVTMSPTAVSVTAGATATLSATVAPSNATNKNVSWSSSNTSVATVNALGVVSGVATGTATITVTTQDGSKIATSAVTVTSISNNSCLLARFGVPRASALPTLNAGFTRVYTLGTNAPNLSSVNNASFNWASSSSSLWDFSVNISNGIPNYYIDFRNMVQNFGQAQPTITFNGTGIVNLDGNKYYANIVDSNNLVLVEVTGKHAIYFSTSTTAPIGCGTARIANATTVVKETNFKFSPNPVKDLLTIEGLSIGDNILVTDMVGKTVFNIIAKQEQELISTSSLPNGMYFVFVGETKTMKLIKE